MMTQEKHILLTFWSHSVLLKVIQYTQSNLMIYNLSMLKKILVINFSDKIIYFLRNFQIMIFYWKLSAMKELSNDL